METWRRKELPEVLKDTEPEEMHSGSDISEIREYLKICCFSSCWKPLNRGIYPWIFIAGLWLVFGGCRTSCPSHPGDRRTESCWDVEGRKERREQEGEQELQMAEASDSPSYKQGFWMAGLYFGAELVQFVTTKKWERNESWLWSTATELPSSWQLVYAFLDLIRARLVTI